MKTFCFTLLFLFSLSSALQADPVEPACPPEKGAQPSDSTPATSSSPSPQPSTTEGAASTKDQVGLTFDPMIPDNPFVEEKNPDRKRLLDKIYKAKIEEAEAKMRLDELDRLQKDSYQRLYKVFEENLNLLKKRHEIMDKVIGEWNWETQKKLLDETDKIWRELDINDARRDGIRKQAEGFHQETLKVIKKRGDAIDQQMGLEYSLERMDARAKETSHQDAQRAAIPKPNN